MRETRNTYIIFVVEFCLGYGHLEGLGDGMVVQGLMKSIKTESVKEKYCAH
jgi:hypothetical protein